MKSEFDPTILGHPFTQETEGDGYTSKLSKALDMAKKFHKLRRRLAVELADLTAMAQERGLGADASILDALHSATLLTPTKFIKQDLDALALGAALRPE